MIVTDIDELMIDLPRNPLVVSGDEKRLVQVFSNLFSNAARPARPAGVRGWGGMMGPALISGQPTAAHRNRPLGGLGDSDGP